MSMLVIQFLLLCAAVSSISLTLSKAGIFRRPREWVEDRNAFLGELVHCPFCTSVWVAFGITAIYHPPLLSTTPFLDGFITAMAMVTIASGLSGITIRAFGNHPGTTHDPD
jgi:hypothetical protein